jgi:superfamily II DNA or RNA helicase
LFSSAERRQIAAKQHHACGVCDGNLPEVFHVHHVIPWADGGPTQVDNGMAVCPECHQNAPTQPLPKFTPRAWQEEALTEILPMLRAGEFATLNAAPGAGKTPFAGWVYRNLAKVGVTARLVVFVPNAHLRGQWADELRKIGIWLDSEGTTERRNRDGVVLTYHALTDRDQLEQLIKDAADLPTLFVLDEVHHLGVDQGGPAGAWSVNIAHIVGTVDRPVQRVLNLSGTLFRSKRSERISTIRYVEVDDRIETQADYSVTAGRLIAERNLRHIKVLAYDAEMRVQAVDLAASAHAGAQTIRAVDLDGATRLRSRVLAEMIRNPRFVNGILRETISRLGHASAAVQGAPVKGLVIADSIEHAEQIHAELCELVGTSNAFIAHGRMASPVGEIEYFRKADRQAILVAVQMVTEGFDAADVCVLTFLRTWRAPLFINQIAARAMRITERERELGIYLPATILVPNEAEVKAAFADVLVGSMQVLQAPPEPCPLCGRDICACPPRPRSLEKQCRRCGMPWRDCICICDECGLSRYHGCQCPRSGPGPGEELTGVDVVSDPELAHISVDGHSVHLHLVEMLRKSLLKSGLPEVLNEQAASAVQQAMKDDPMAYLSVLKEEEEL